MLELVKEQFWPRIYFFRKVSAKTIEKVQVKLFSLTAWQSRYS